MDRTLDVRTPESIAFSYELAGVGSRFLAVMIDMAAQIGLLALIVWGLFLIGIAHLTTLTHTGGDVRFVHNVAAGVVIFVIFIIFFGYFILFEAFWSGQTPGKRALGIRVVRDGGYPIDLTAVLVRNLIRVGELALGFYAVAAASALLSKENKRIGDYAAGTIVVRESKMTEPDFAANAANAEPVYAPTAYATGEERALIKRFLERREELTPERRAELASSIAARMRARLPEDLRRLDDEALLERL
jgi:uncharacterized RDD family membrane protein YckC